MDQQLKMTKRTWHRLPARARRDFALARWAARPRRRPLTTTAHNPAMLEAQARWMTLGSVACLAGSAGLLLMGAAAGRLVWLAGVLTH